MPSVSLPVLTAVYLYNIDTSRLAFSALITKCVTEYEIY